MRLFLKDHLDVIALFLFESVAIALAFRFVDGFASAAGVAYFLFVSVFVLAAFLIVRFMRKRAFYESLEAGADAMEKLLEHHGSDPVTAAYVARGRDAYRSYQRRLNERDEEMLRWRTHVMQWVHQMKTPVSVLRLMVQKDPGRIDSFDALCELDRMQGQLDLVLSFVRMERMQADLAIEDVPLKRTVDAVIAKERRLFVQKEVFPAVDIDAGLRVRTDGKWLAFVIEQMLHNAVKYSDAASTIEVGATASDAGVTLSIVDHGIGIRERDLPRIFDLYFTGSNGRDHDQSSGIGLYVAKHVLDEFGHGIEVESKLGAGTCMRITF